MHSANYLQIIIYTDAMIFFGINPSSGKKDRTGSIIQQLALMVLFSLTVVSASFAQTVFNGRAVNRLSSKMDKNPGFFPGYHNFSVFRPDSVGLDKKNKKIELHFSPSLTYIPLREQVYFEEIKKARKAIGRKYRHFDIKFFSGKHELTELIPNFYRSTLPLNPATFQIRKTSDKVLFRRSTDTGITNGLRDKHIAIWPSHGRYFNQKLSRWEWQRPRLHTTVEDMLTATFVFPYLAPMLENAGAITLIPRERDINIDEFIVDNDITIDNNKLEINLKHIAQIDTVQGFTNKQILIGNENPFTLGTALIIESMWDNSANSDDRKIIARYLPEITKRGNYAVYISYPEGNGQLGQVFYTVNALNGSFSFLVDQSIGGNMWIYLGHFDLGPVNSSQTISIDIEVPVLQKTGFIGVDAVKIGGGMGNIARKSKNPTLTNQENDWKTSGYPRFMEAARYFMQYSGIPDSIVYSLSKGENDYNDDYQSRGEWVNYLIGNPNGPSGYRKIRGKGIPVDLSFAFHTDAGVTNNDSVIGTLGIYSSETEEGLYPDGRSRMSSRELTDLIQTQIVEDIQTLINPKWVRRGLWDRKYSEAFRPNVPSMLLELLSHQNLADMTYGMDPEFRFTVSRAIYKGMLKYLHFQDTTGYVVQPLPVNSFSIDFSGERHIKLNWKATKDELEPSANPDAYNLYERKGNGPFLLIAENIRKENYEHQILEPDQIYSYRIVAVNRGGSSFPSEILSAGISSLNKGKILVVNAFNRLSAPRFFDVGKMAGFGSWMDEGISDGFEFGMTGKVYDYFRSSVWLDNESPGWGASHADEEGLSSVGNTFDNCYIHGKSILKAGYSFTSKSKEAFLNEKTGHSDVNIIDIIYGEERTKFGLSGLRFAVLEKAMCEKLDTYLLKGVNLLLSGAHIGTDMMERKDSFAIQFASNKLGFAWRTDHADKSGSVVGLNPFISATWNYNTKFDKTKYRVESPDAIYPSLNNASPVLRYSETGSVAAVLFNGFNYRVVSLGFPFESISLENQRDDLMQQILQNLINSE